MNEAQQINITLSQSDVRLALKLSERAKTLFAAGTLPLKVITQLSPQSVVVGDEFQFGGIQNSPTLVVTKRSWVLQLERDELTIWLDAP